MSRSYVGISTRAGLESFQPETEFTARALARRAYWPPAKRARCWWVVLEDATAAEVFRAIAAGDRDAALATIDRAADCRFGPVLPSDFVSP
jgi:hypothetical protein